MDLVQCMWCKGMFPDKNGPAHDYMESTPGCWAAYGRVLARQYEDQRYFAVHRLAVDSYAVQHPGIQSRQSIQSVGVHLIRLHLFLEKGLAPDKANDAMLAAAKHKAEYHWLEPPASLGAITVADIEATEGEQHMTMVKDWASQIWQVWSAHHSTIRTWANAT